MQSRSATTVGFSRDDCQPTPIIFDSVQTGEIIAPPFTAPELCERCRYLSVSLSGLRGCSFLLQYSLLFRLSSQLRSQSSFVVRIDALAPTKRLPCDVSYLAFKC
jgi:hypothetical protein